MSRTRAGVPAAALVDDVEQSFLGEAVQRTNNPIRPANGLQGAHTVNGPGPMIPVSVRLASREARMRALRNHIDTSLDA